MSLRKMLNVCVLVISVLLIQFCKDLPSVNNEEPGSEILSTSGVWAYGQHSFRSQELREVLGFNGNGKGQWGWIFELETEKAVTQLIVDGGNEDGTKPADQVGTIVGSLKIAKYSDLLQVIYYANSGYRIEDLHLWVGCSLEEFPWKGITTNVAPGRFPYTYKEASTDYYVFSIDLNNYNCSGNLFLSAHGGELIMTGEERLSNPIVKNQKLGLLSVSDSVEETYARAINDHGEIVGNQWIRVCTNEECDDLITFENLGFRWTREEGLMTIPTILEFFDNNPASDINNNREIVGFRRGEGAFFLDYPEPMGTSPIGLGSLLGGDLHNSDALAINDLGQVVGYAETSTGEEHAFIWDESSGITDLGTLPGHLRSRAIDINNLGQVVGWSQSTSSSDRRYFLWDETNGMTDLGASPIRSINDLGEISSAIAINNHGQTVNEDGYLYDPEIGPVQLNGGGSCTALDLNNNGQIAGWCFNESNTERAVMWEVQLFSKQQLSRLVK